MDRDCAKEPTGHGSPLPSLVHGGPGQAGGGELRSVFHCMQRTALQCSPGRLVSFTGNWIKGAQAPIAEEHLFKRDYDQLAIGDTIKTKADQLLNSPPPVGPTSPLHRYRHRQRRWRPARKPRYRAPFCGRGIAQAQKDGSKKSACFDLEILYVTIRWVRILRLPRPEGRQPARGRIPVARD